MGMAGGGSGAALLWLVGLLVLGGLLIVMLVLSLASVLAGYL